MFSLDGKVQSGRDRGCRRSVKRSIQPRTPHLHLFLRLAPGVPTRATSESTAGNTTTKARRSATGACKGNCGPIRQYAGVAGSVNGTARRLVRETRPRGKDYHQHGKKAAPAHRFAAGRGGSRVDTRLR